MLAVLDGAHPSPVRVKLQHGDVLEVADLEGITQLAFLRRVLAGGFQVGSSLSKFTATRMEYLQQNC